jgi:hypothetical protein
MSARDIVLSSGGSSGTPVYVDDVFSTYLYTGTGAAQTINNGIDLAGKGGLVWMKCRSGANPNALFDTVRGGNNLLFTNTGAQVDVTGEGVTSFNANGFSIGNNVNWNQSAQTFASWTFRKAPKFFDIVTYTGNGSIGRSINHNLGSAPGMVIIKCTSAVGNWFVWHRGLNNGQPTQSTLFLNTTAVATSTNYIFYSSTGVVSDTQFGGFGAYDPGTNASGQTYVAYLFAHDAGGFGLAGTDNVISCGSWTGNGGTTSVTLGFEPQYVLYKQANGVGNWWVMDTMRGMTANANVSGTDYALFANTAESESATYSIDPTATGFGAHTGTASTGKVYIYMAIRRPMKPPTSGTEVFDVGQNRSTGGISNRTNGSMGAVDLTMQTQVPNPLSPYHFTLFDRLRGSNYLATFSTGAESSGSVYFDTNVGVRNGLWFSDGGLFYNFRRASGFFDVVCYTGTGVARTVNHNLGVAPELMIVKRRSGNTGEWGIYCSLLVSPINSYLQMNRDISKQTQTNLWSNITTSTFGYGSGNPAWGDFNAPDGTYVAYLFATLAGISKVGSYTGNGTSQTIACGFATGARFIMIKRTDSTGDWYVWDSARGIVSANDPHLSLNSTAAEVTTDDSVDPDNSGFIVNQVAATNINVTSATYIFLAIA